MNITGLEKLVLSEKDEQPNSEEKQHNNTPSMELDSISNDQTPTIQNGSKINSSNSHNSASFEEVMMERNGKTSTTNSKVEVMTTWEEMMIAGETSTFIPASKAEIRKVRGTIQAKKLTSTEIKEWKNRNMERYDQILNTCERKEYKLIRVLVEAVEEDREKRRRAQMELETINKLMSMNESNTNNGQYEQ